MTFDVNVCTVYPCVPSMCFHVYFLRCRHMCVGWAVYIFLALQGLALVYLQDAV